MDAYSTPSARRRGACRRRRRVEILLDAAADAEPATEPPPSPPPRRPLLLRSAKKRLAAPGAIPRARRGDDAWRAAEHGDVARLKRLLDARGDVNRSAPSRGWRQKSVLSAAVDGNEPAAVRLEAARRRPEPAGTAMATVAAALGVGRRPRREARSPPVQARAALDVVDHGWRTPLEFARHFSSSWFGLGGGRPQVVALLERFPARRRAAAGPTRRRRRCSRTRCGRRRAKATSRRSSDSSAAASPSDAKCPNTTAPLPALSIAVYHDQRDARPPSSSRGADANARDGRHGMAPLHYAAHAVDRAEFALTAARRRL